MASVYYRFLLCCCLLLPGVAVTSWAQAGYPANCTGRVTANQPAEAFLPYDATTQQLLTGFYPGQRVEFRPNPTRGITNLALLLYAVADCNFSGPASRTVTIPSEPGSVYITENYNVTGAGTTYIREFPVYACPPPAFQLTRCAGNAIRVAINPLPGTVPPYTRYTVQVGNAAPVTVAPTDTGPYLVPAGGPYTVTVRGSYGPGVLCEGTQTTSFEPLPAPQTPVLERLTLQDNTILLQFRPLQAAYRYEIQSADASNGTVLPDNSVTGLTLPATTPDGCYRLRLTDICQTAAFTYSSNSICPVTLQVTSADGRNSLVWATSAAPAGSRYDITRDGQLLATVTGLTRYEDAAVSCGRTYRYRVTASLPAVGSVTPTSVSNEAAATTLSSVAPAAALLIASFNLRNHLALMAFTPQNSTEGQLTYFREGALLATTPARTLSDSSLAPGTGACYTARLLDACGNTSAPSAAACPAMLTAQAGDADGNSVRLTWTELRGPDPSVPVSYRLESIGVAGTVQDRGPVTGFEFIDQALLPDQLVLRYRLRAVAGGGLPPGAVSYSNTVTVVRRYRLFVPTAFTPNGDGLNDVLEVKGRFPDQFLFVVVNRDGQEVFRGTDRTQRWDGRVRGNAPVPGAYVWRFEATDETGQRIVQHGTITILR